MTVGDVRKRSLDAIDESILRVLVRDARTSYRDIAAEVRLSANAVAQRMRRLEAAGVIRGYRAVLDPMLDAAAVSAVIHVRTAIDVDSPAVEARLAAMPEVVEVLDLAGPIDYEIRLHCPDQDTLYAAVQTIRLLPGFMAMETRLVLREVVRR